MKREKFVTPKIWEIGSDDKNNNMCLNGEGTGNMCSNGSNVFG